MDKENQAQITFMHRVLRAVVRSHPNPGALRDAWRDESSEALAQLGIHQVRLSAPGDVKHEFQQAFWQWNGVISEAAARAADDDQQ